MGVEVVPYLSSFVEIYEILRRYMRFCGEYEILWIGLGPW